MQAVAPCTVHQVHRICPPGGGAASTHNHKLSTFFELYLAALQCFHPWNLHGRSNRGHSLTAFLFFPVFLRSSFSFCMDVLYPAEMPYACRLLYLAKSQ